MEVELRRGRRRRPRLIGLPRIRAGLKGRGLPRKLLALAVEPVTEPRRLDLLAELQRGVMAAERHEADRLGFRIVPLSVKPRAGDDDVVAVRIALLGPAINLPRTPRILLIPEAGDVQVRNEGALDLIDPGFFLPERIVVWVLDNRIPVRDRTVQVLRVDVRQRPERQVPGISVVRLEAEMCVRVLVRLLVHGVLERVALTQRAVAMVVVVHPLIGRRRLLGDRRQRRMWLEQRHR